MNCSRRKKKIQHITTTLKIPFKVMHLRFLQHLCNRKWFLYTSGCSCISWLLYMYFRTLQSSWERVQSARLQEEVLWQTEPIRGRDSGQLAEVHPSSPITRQDLWSDEGSDRLMVFWSRWKQKLMRPSVCLPAAWLRSWLKEAAELRETKQDFFLLQQQTCFCVFKVNRKLSKEKLSVMLANSNSSHLMVV